MQIRRAVNKNPRMAGNDQCAAFEVRGHVWFNGATGAGWRRCVWQARRVSAGVRVPGSWWGAEDAGRTGRQMAHSSRGGSRSCLWDTDREGGGATVWKGSSFISSNVCKKKNLEFRADDVIWSQSLLGGECLFAMVAFVWTSHQESRNFTLTQSLDAKDDTSSFSSSKPN